MKVCSCCLEIVVMQVLMGVATVVAMVTKDVTLHDCCCCCWEDEELAEGGVVVVLMCWPAELRLIFMRMHLFCWNGLPEEASCEDMLTAL